MSFKSSTGMIYAGAVLFLALVGLSIYYFQMEWQASIENSKAHELYEIVHNVIPNRPTDTPGAVAWLHMELEKYLSNTEGMPEFAQLQEHREVPRELQPWADFMANYNFGATPEPFPVTASGLDDVSDLPTLQFRSVSLVNKDDEQFVMTRRSKLGDDLNNLDVPSNLFLHRSLPFLSSIHNQLRSLEKPDSSHGYHIVRYYTLCEDGMLTLLPLPTGGLNQGEAIRREGRAMFEMAKLPSFVANVFFFSFDFEKADHFYSAIYPDLGGQGLVASLIAPMKTGEGDKDLNGIVGMDIAFDLQWDQFAASIEEPLIVERVSLKTHASDSGWRPWEALDRAKPKNEHIKVAIRDLAENEKNERYFHNPSPIYHGVPKNGDPLVAFRVSPDDWLVILFPSIESQFPLKTLILASLVFLSLLIFAEHNRRSAVAAGRKAIAEFEEKQNLLETMQVPLMVVDPNTEIVVYGNRPALELGIQVGRSVKELVADDPQIRRHYEQMQVVEREERRAYGLPLKVGDQTRHAVVRSVAVTAPIETIHADERHRLGILFLLDEERDLGIYTRQLTQKVMDEERFRLAGLLDHGVNSLASILARRLRQGDHGDFVTWLSGYIQRRISLSAWVLNHWETMGPLPPDCIIEVGHAKATLERLDQIFCMVRQDTNLRAQLHWNNGILSDGACETGRGILDLRFSWPPEYSFFCPVRGGFGFFLGEVLVNAVRHGRPGGRVSTRIRLDPIRKELIFEVSNPAGNSEPAGQREKQYGGRAILEQLARLFDWQDLSFLFRDGHFTASWRVPCGERAGSLESD